MNPLVVGPEGVGDVRIAQDVRSTVPVREPDVVGVRERRIGVGDELLHRRARASVDARDVPLRVQLVRPRTQEPFDGQVAARPRAVVGLHVEVDGAADAETEGRRFADRVVGRTSTLGPRIRRRDRCEVALARAGRLQPDVEGH